MFVIVGLGNPGLKFDSTRHNIGFEVIEKLAYDHNIKVDRKKHKALVGQGVIKGYKCILVKPQTYMNLSGESVREIMDYYNCDLEELIVVYDDTSLEVGSLRIREKGSAGGHNGIKNIILQMTTNEFLRVKVGVGQKPPGWDLANWVLGRFDKADIPVMVDSVKTSAKAVEALIIDGPKVAMNQFNRKKKEKPDE